MYFCSECGNMYYIKITDKMIYYCRKCGHEDDNLTKDKICVSKTDFTKATNFDIVNEYTKLDPTLPRRNNIQCPNKKCVESNEVIYLRYDDSNMKYIYICSHCDTIWKTDEYKN